MAKRGKSDIWQNRIIEHGTAPANQFLAHELNARRHPGHQRDALRGSLNEVGWVAPVIVSAKTGKLLDGHARIEEALTRDENAEVPFIKVDVSEGEERLILASFDPITTMARYDQETLTYLLDDINTDNQALIQIFEDLQWETESTVIDSSNENARDINKKSGIAKAVFFVEDLAVIEEAIQLVGNRNRGESLLSICKDYLNAKR